MYKCVYGKQTEPPICTQCTRVTSENDPEVRYKHGEIIACGACYKADQIQRQRQKELAKQRRQTTLIAARRYCNLFADASIVGMSIDRQARLMRKHPAGHFVFVAEIVKDK